MTETNRIGLVSLADSSLMLAHPEDDLRGLTVLDPQSHRVGDIEGIIMDEVERRVRFLIVVSGGILGMGGTRRLVPIEAVTQIDEQVHIEASDEHVYDSDEYDPDLVPLPAYVDAYGHFGYPPFWARR